MALTKPIYLLDTPIGAELAACYVRVTRGAFSESRLDFTLGYYASRAARIQGRAPIWTKSYYIDPFDFATSGNVKRAIYDYLKTQAEFVVAQDA